jgi:hypothetical protein
MKRNATISIEEGALDGYEVIYGKKTAGVTVAAQQFLPLREKTLKELKGVFSKNELLYIIQCLSALNIKHTHMAKATLIYYIEDGNLKQAGFDFGELKKKVYQLTAAQSYYLMDRVIEYP